MSFPLGEPLRLHQEEVGMPPAVTSALKSAEDVVSHLRRYGSEEIGPFLGFVTEHRISGSAYNMLERKHLEEWLGADVRLWGPISELLSFKQSEQTRMSGISLSTVKDTCRALLRDPILRDRLLSEGVSREPRREGEEKETRARAIRAEVRRRLEERNEGKVEVKVKNPTPGVRRIIRFLEKKRSGNGYVLLVRYNTHEEPEWVKRSAIPKNVSAELERFCQLWDSVTVQATAETSAPFAAPDILASHLTPFSASSASSAPSNSTTTSMSQAEESVLAALPPPPGVLPEVLEKHKTLEDSGGTDMDYWSSLEELQASRGTREDVNGDGVSALDTNSEEVGRKRARSARDSSGNVVANGSARKRRI